MTRLACGSSLYLASCHLPGVNTRMLLAELSDDECVALSQKGDQKAFAELVRRYQGRVFRFILRMTNSRDEALELTQETFLKVFQNIAEWQPTALFRTWLFRIATNSALDTLRRRKVVEYVPIEEDMDFADHRVNIEAQLQTIEEYRILDWALTQLGHEHREVLLLREIEDMSYADIADTLGIAEGTVKSRIARARAALLEICQEKNR